MDVYFNAFLHTNVIIIVLYFCSDLTLRLLFRATGHFVAV